MSESYSGSIEAMYDEWSEEYDKSFHFRSAQDYVKYAVLKEGEKVLDLACGTGLVALLAKEAVGESGHVVGIDISSGMLEVARRKSKQSGIDVEFINHDISDLDGLRLLPENSEGFDVITCASALILLGNPLQAVKHWTSWLTPGGRLITDVPAESANIAMKLLEAIGPEIGQPLKWEVSRWQSQESLEKLLAEAGLGVERVFQTEAYGGQDYDVNDAPQIFEKAVASPMLRSFGQEAVREKAKALFIENFRQIAGSEGIVHEEVILHMGIARKQICGKIADQS